MNCGLTSAGGFVVATLVDGQGMHSGVQCRTNADIDSCKTTVRNVAEVENKP